MLACSASGVSNIKDIASYTVNQFTTSYVRDYSILRWALIGYPCTDHCLFEEPPHHICSTPSRRTSHHMLHPITCSTHHVAHPITSPTPSRRPPHHVFHHVVHPITCSTPSHAPPHHMLHPITCSTPSHAPPYHMVHSITCPTPSHGPDNYIYNIRYMLGELDQEFRNMYLRLHNAELELLIT